MLPQEKRLTTAEFNRFFASGRRIHTPYFQLIVAPAASGKGAVVVGKKVSKQAVIRNRLRRQLYPVLRAHIAATSPAAYIVVVKPSLLTLTKAERSTALATALATLPTFAETMKPR